VVFDAYASGWIGRMLRGVLASGYLRACFCSRRGIINVVCNAFNMALERREDTGGIAAPGGALQRISGVCISTVVSA
jgi:hypothetical protein